MAKSKITADFLVTIQLTEMELYVLSVLLEYPTNLIHDKFKDKFQTTDQYKITYKTKPGVHEALNSIKDSLKKENYKIQNARLHL